MQSFDTNTQVLQTTIEDVVRIPLETTDALPIGLEDASGSIESYFTLSGGGTDDGFYDEGFPHTGIVDETDGEPIVLNADELTGDAFISLEDDTGDILRTEPNSFIEKTFFLLEDSSGVLVREDAEETTKKIIREFPRADNQRELGWILFNLRQEEKYLLLNLSHQELLQQVLI